MAGSSYERIVFHNVSLLLACTIILYSLFRSTLLYSNSGFLFLLYKPLRNPFILNSKYCTKKCANILFFYNRLDLNKRLIDNSFIDSDYYCVTMVTVHFEIIIRFDIRMLGQNTDIVNS